MRKTCPDCGKNLVWIQVIDRNESGNVEGFEYVDAGTPKSYWSGYRKHIEGTIQAGRCPSCDRVLFYACPWQSQNTDTSVSVPMRPLAAQDIWISEPPDLRPDPGVANTRQLEKEVEEAAALGQQGVPRLTEVFLNKKLGDGVRSKALEFLYNLVEKKDLTDVIVKGLSTIPPATRLSAYAVKALLKVGDETTVHPLSVLFHRAINQNQVRIVRAFGQIGSEPAKKILMRWLEYPNTFVKCAVIKALTGTGGAEGFEQLVVECLDDPETEVVVEAINALGQIGSPKHLPVLSYLSGGLFRSGDTKAAAKAAITVIKSQPEYASKGGLSVLDGQTGGALSIPVEPGALTTPEKDD